MIDNRKLDADDVAVDNELNRLLCEGLAAREVPVAERTAVRGRVLTRVGDSIRRHAGVITVRAQDGAWHDVKNGIRAKTLWQGPEGASVLIEFAAGAMLPVHRHHHLEEGIVLAGGLQLGELDLGPGDYHVSLPGSRHGRIASRQGGLAYLRGTSLGDTKALLGELLGGLLPHAGGAPITVSSRVNGWRSIADGVEEKLLHREGDQLSRFLRFAAGARLPARVHRSAEECMLIEGEAFLGDILLRAGEYQVAPAATEYGEICSDTGGVLFLRGDAREQPEH